MDTELRICVYIVLSNKKKNNAVHASISGGRVTY